MARETFQVGDLTAVIGDNEDYDGHRAGYNGVHRLTHRTNLKSLFTVTGWWLGNIDTVQEWSIVSAAPGTKSLRSTRTGARS